MKKLLKAMFALLLTAVIVIGAMPLAGFFTTKANATSYEDGDIIEFGSYPQEQVVDEQLIATLNALDLNWISYNYYSGDGSKGSMVPGDYMKYADVTHEGNRYRAVIMYKYRPCWTYNKNNIDNVQTYQDYCYNLNTIYWFKWKPIKWRIIDADKKMIVSEYLIDSQAFSNTVYASQKDGELQYYNDANCTTSVRDYYSSSIRKWLNNDFYNLAFNDDEKSSVSITTLDNSCYDPTKPEYNGADTKDKVFLLSYSDLTDYSSVLNSKVYYTNYARSQNVCDTSSNPLSFYYSIWYTRTPRDQARVCGIDEKGAINSNYCYSAVYNTSGGVRPAVILSEFPTQFSLDSYFEVREEEEKRTKRANVKPNDKMRFVESIIGSDLLNAPSDKAKEIKNKIYDLFFLATYRAEFGEDREDIIINWPYHNDCKLNKGKGGKIVNDSGLNQTVDWGRNSKGCASYVRFVSYYIYKSTGNNKSKTESLQNSDELKNLILNYADPGEAIHYKYTNKKKKTSQHWVVYVGNDDAGFYFLTYEGGRNNSGGAYHDINLEYVTYEHLAESCKGLLVEVWDTNNGSYRKQTADNSVHKSTRLEITLNAFAKVFVDGILKYSSSLGAKTSTQSPIITFTFPAGEKHEIKIVGDSVGTFNCKVTYIMSDEKQNTREFINVPIGEMYTVTTSIANCYEQGYVDIDKNNDQQADEIWSAGMNEVSKEPLPQEYDIIEIIRNPSTTTISYGDSIILHADISALQTNSYDIATCSTNTCPYCGDVFTDESEYNKHLANCDGESDNNDEQPNIPIQPEQPVVTPSNLRIEWTASNGNFSYSVSDDGTTCTISPLSSGETTFTATVYDEDGNVVGYDTQTMTSKAGFFDKIIAFFKKLFGLTKTIPQIYKGIF